MAERRAIRPYRGPVAEGARDGHPRDVRRVVVGFDEETFAQIRRRAVAEQTSFGEQVRRLVEWGLEAK